MLSFPFLFGGLGIAPRVHSCSATELQSHIYTGITEAPPFTMNSSQNRIHAPHFGTTLMLPSQSVLRRYSETPHDPPATASSAAKIIGI